MRLNNRIAVGENGLLFLYGDSNGFGMNLIDRKNDFSQLRLSDYFIQLLNGFESKNIEFYLFIYADKFCVLNHLLPDWLRFDVNDVVKYRPALKLKSFNNVDFFNFDLIEPPLDKYFFSGDSHYNAGGGLLLSKFICNRIGLNPGLDYFDKLESEISYVHYAGDLFDGLNSEEKKLLENYCSENNYQFYPRLEKYLDLSIVNAAQTTRAEAKYGVHSDNFYENTKYSDARRCLLFRQSTGAYLEKVFGENFREIRSHYSDGVINGGIIDEFNPDIIVHVITEKFVSRFFDI